MTTNYVGTVAEDDWMLNVKAIELENGLVLNLMELEPEERRAVKERVSKMIQDGEKINDFITEFVKRREKNRPGLVTRKD